MPRKIKVKFRKKKTASTVRYMSDGRELVVKGAVGRQERIRRQDIVLVRQNGLCWVCREPLPLSQVEMVRHGGERDDRIEDEYGRAISMAVHRKCRLRLLAANRRRS